LGIQGEKMPNGIGKWHSNACNRVVHIALRPEEKPDWEFEALSAALSVKSDALRHAEIVPKDWEGDRLGRTTLIKGVYVGARGPRPSDYKATQGVGASGPGFSIPTFDESLTDVIDWVGKKPPGVAAGKSNVTLRRKG
jgi:hypothetical protein